VFLELVGLSERSLWDTMANGLSASRTGRRCGESDVLADCDLDLDPPPRLGRPSLRRDGRDALVIFALARTRRGNLRPLTGKGELGRLR
jgi:hypothetical protein